jgi:hypothetical protein
VVEVKRYQATAVQSGEFWHIEVPEVGRVTQARHLREVEAMARDLIAIMTDRDPGSIDVDVTVVLPESVRGHLHAAEDLRRQASAAQARAARELRAAVRELRDRGLALRDVGAALGISYQRVHQLLESPGADAAPDADRQPVGAAH